MISREELLESARTFDLNEADVQRDYVFGWLISGIFRESALAGDLVLKGGNALRKGYFPGTRFSDDLDLSSASGMNADHVLVELNRVCDFAEQHAGIKFDTARNRLVDEMQIDKERLAYKFRLYFRDFLGPRDHVTLSVRMDLTEFDRLHLPPQTRQLIHPYSDADACSTAIRCVKLEEALADKLKCLLQRRYCYDLFDLVYATFISQEIAIDRTEMMGVFFRKTIFGGSPHAAKSLLLDLPFDLLRGYWGTVLCPKGSRMAFDDAVAAMRAGIESLFAPLPTGAQFAGHFFPSRLRNPILQAASELRLLRLRYDGVTRLVEPYSLTYKRRVDGKAFEYFYVYDRTGGRSSGPGIKSFFQHKIEGLEIAEETFTPRFAMELSKAGDIGTAGTFAAQRTSRMMSGLGGRPTVSRRRSVSSGPVYIIECSYCGKHFSRKTQSTKMNKHTDSYGNQCYGRAGFHVDTRY